LAGQRIKQTLDLGTPASKLLQNAEADAKQFAEGMTAEEQKMRVDVRERILAELAFRMENGLYQNLVDTRMHGVLREVVRRALDPETVETRRKAAYGQRLEALYREEL